MKRGTSRAETAVRAKRGNERLHASITRAIGIGLYLALLTPLPVWNGALFPHVTPKVLLFQALVEILCGLALLSALIRPGPATAPVGVSWLSATPMMAGMFLLVSLVSALFGTDPNRSLWGFLDRQDGLVLLAHCLAWLLVFDWHLRTWDSGQRQRLLVRYLTVSFSVSVVAALSVVWQGYQANPEAGASLVGRILGSTARRPGGVMGNPILTGPYLMIHFFWGLFLASAALRAPGRFRAARVAALVAGEALIVTAILAGQTRGVILGMAAGLLVLALYATFSRSLNAVARLGTASALLLLAAAGPALWYFRDAPLVKRVPVLTRLTRMSPGESTTTKNRLLAWRSALRGFQQDPLLGSGHDNVYYVLNRYYDPRQVQFAENFTQRSETWYDKTHNYYLDLLVEKGLAGVLAFLALVFAVVGSLRRLPDRSMALCAAGALAGYLAGNAVAFDGFGSLFGLFLTLGAVSIFEDPIPPSRRRHLSRHERTKDKGPGSAKGVRVFAACGAGVLALCALYANVEMARAIHGYFLARSAFLQDPAAGISRYEDAFRRFSPYHAGEKLNCAYLAVNSVITNRAASRSFDAGELVLRLSREALAAHPNDAQYYVLLNDMYNGLTMYADKGFGAQAEAFGRRALELSPNRQEAMFTLARTYVIAGEPRKAVELNRRMVEADPDFGLGHWFLGLSLMADNQRDNARREIQRALEAGYRFQSPQEMEAVKSLFSESEFAALSRVGGGGPPPPR